jgi:hypothetical protein
MLTHGAVNQVRALHVAAKRDRGGPAVAGTTGLGMATTSVAAASAVAGPEVLSASSLSLPLWPCCLTAVPGLAGVQSGEREPVHAAALLRGGRRRPRRGRRQHQVSGQDRVGIATRSTQLVKPIMLLGVPCSGRVVLGSVAASLLRVADGAVVVECAASRAARWWATSGIPGRGGLPCRTSSPSRSRTSWAASTASAAVRSPPLLWAMRPSPDMFQGLKVHHQVGSCNGARSARHTALSLSTSRRLHDTAMHVVVWFSTCLTSPEGMTSEAY